MRVIESIRKFQVNYNDVVLIYLLLICFFFWQVIGWVWNGEVMFYVSIEFGMLLVEVEVFLREYEEFQRVIEVY